MALRAGPVGRALTIASGAILGTVTVAVVSGSGLGSPSFADSSQYELFCPGSPVGNIVINDVVTSGALSPANPGAGQQFDVAGYATTFVLPNSIVGAAAALGNSDIIGTATEQVDATGASPSTMSGGTARFDVPIPSPVPDQGLVVDLPAVSVGPFTASGNDIKISQDQRMTMTLTISGSALTVHCSAYPNHSAASGVIARRPYGRPFSPVIALAAIPLAVTSTSLPAGTLGHRYSAPLAASGGDPPYSWKLATGSNKLPKGLRLNRRSGVISGIPSYGDPPTSTFTVEVMDTNRLAKPHRQETATETLSLTIT
jgi:Putative Ig domain